MAGAALAGGHAGGDGVATVSGTGLASGVALGRTDITATLGSLTGRISLTVLPPLRAITIPPSVLTIFGGQTIQLRAFGTFADGSNLDITAFAAWASDALHIATVTGGRLTAHRPGSATITASLQGVTGSLALTATAFAPTITITSPADGATLTADRVLVRGTVAGATTDLGVVVNGRLANVNSGQWAVELPLTQGSNAISAIGTDLTGASVTTTVTVQVDEAKEPVLVLKASPVSGLSPLTVRFEVESGLDRPIVRYQFDSDGDGRTDLTSSSFENVQVTYTGRGTITPLLTVTDDRGRTFTATTVIQVLDLADTITMFQLKWEALKSALAARDIPGATAEFAVGVRDRFMPVFQALDADLPTIAPTMGTVAITRVAEGLAEGVVQRVQDGSVFLYFIYWGLDADGIWRIIEM